MTTVKQGVQLDVELRLPVRKLWEALRNMHDVAPKMALNLRHQKLRGNGGVGSVSVTQFADGRCETERVDVVDDKTHTLVSTVTAHEAARGLKQYTKSTFLSSARDGTTTIARWRAECMPSVDGLESAGIASDAALAVFKALETCLVTPNCEDVSATSSSIERIESLEASVPT